MTGEEHIRPGGSTPASGGAAQERPHDRLAPAHPENVAPGAPPRTDQAITTHPPPLPQASRQPVRSPDEEILQRSELENLVRWFAGLVIILGAGWGFVALAGYQLMTRFGWSLEAVAATLYVVSFGLFFTLEKGLWLSRFMGLRLGPGSTALKETLFFWILGVAGLLLRSTAAERPAPLPSERKTSPPTESTREIVETVVFVVVLVLLLKTFLAEAFVIPTGSMADTLLGYHKTVQCEQCGYKFRVNLSREVDPDVPPPRPVMSARCPNCEYLNRLRSLPPEQRGPGEDNP